MVENSARPLIHQCHMIIGMRPGTGLRPVLALIVPTVRSAPIGGSGATCEALTGATALLRAGLEIPCLTYTEGTPARPAGNASKKINRSISGNRAPATNSL